MDLSAYFSDLLRTKKPEQEKKTFWFPIPEHPGITEALTPIQTRILRELREMKKKEKLKPKSDIKSQLKFLKRFDWTDTLLMETE